MSDRGPDEREVTTEWGAGLTRWLPVSLSVKRTITDRWKARVDDFGAKVVEEAGLSADDAAQRLADNEVLADACIAAADKAGRTADGHFRGGLAKLVAAGLRDDALVDESSYYLSVLTELEPVHLRYLAANIKAERQLAQAGQPGNASVDFVATLAAIPPTIASSVAERLHAVSLLTDRMRGGMIDWTKIPRGAFAVTEAGYALMRYCEQHLPDQRE
jgi:hypothetical protein